MLVWSGVEKSVRTKAGITVLINKYIKELSLGYSGQYVHERYLILDLRNYSVNVTFLMVYAPILLSS